MDSDRIIGVAQQMRGSVEAEAGRLIGDTKLQVEGRAEQAAGTLRNTAGSIRDADHEVADDPQAEVERLRAEVERISAEPATPRLDV
ncbi:CsbD family protein, partial [Paracraurococcus lichenis]